MLLALWAYSVRLDGGAHVALTGCAGHSGKCQQSCHSGDKLHTSAGMAGDQAKAYMSASAALHPIGRVGVPDDVAEL